MLPRRPVVLGRLCERNLMQSVVLVWGMLWKSRGLIPLRALESEWDPDTWLVSPSSNLIKFAAYWGSKEAAIRQLMLMCGFPKWESQWEIERWKMDMVIWFVCLVTLVLSIAGFWSSNICFYLSECAIKKKVHVCLETKLWLCSSNVVQDQQVQVFS